MSMPVVRCDLLMMCVSTLSLCLSSLTQFGMTPLMEAAQMRNLPVVTELLRHGANLKIESTLIRRSALGWIMRELDVQQLGELQKLKLLPIPPDKSTPDKSTPDKSTPDKSKDDKDAASGEGEGETFEQCMARHNPLVTFPAQGYCGTYQEMQAYKLAKQEMQAYKLAKRA